MINYMYYSLMQMMTSDGTSQSGHLCKNPYKIFNTDTSVGPEYYYTREHSHTKRCSDRFALTLIQKNGQALPLLVLESNVLH